LFAPETLSFGTIGESDVFPLTRNRYFDREMAISTNGRDVTESGNGISLASAEVKGSRALG
jgi:hypothetical protein